jgi:uncharacterized alpha-E superfamily protein
MLSRIAESLFWMGRYVERMENTARLLDVNYHATLEGAGALEAQWEPLLDITFTKDTFGEFFTATDTQSVSLWLAVHTENSASVLSSLTFARENARSLRNRISTEMWESLNMAYHSICSKSGFFDESSLHHFCNEARDASHLFFGIAEATLPRDMGWHFLQSGRMVERADNVARLLEVIYPLFTHHQGGMAALTDHHRWTALLKSVSAYEAYLKTPMHFFESQSIAAFLLLSPKFPRSLSYSLATLADHLERIAKENPGVPQNVQRKLGWLRAQLEYIDHVDDVLTEEKPSLAQLLESINQVAAEITKSYFALKEF